MQYRPARVLAASLLFLVGALAASRPGFPGAAWAGTAATEECRPTPSDAEGPFYRPGAPVRSSTGKGLIVGGRIQGAAGCLPLPGARVEWWQAGPSGTYDEGHRGSLAAGPDGGYTFSTDFPGDFPGRPPHIHLKVSAPGHKELTTQLYLKRGEKEKRFDIVLVPRKPGP